MTFEIPKKITLQQLKSAGACEEQCRLFTTMFGKETVVTVELAEKYAHMFAWGWAAENLLSHPAQDEYYKVCSTAWTEYEKAWDEYEKVRNTARDEYYKVRDTAQAKVDKVCARAFASLYLAD